jgi:hypothetical protein
MRALLFATTLGTAQSLAVGAKSKKPAIQALMESATTMLKNGATPAVVDFAEETLGEIGDVVIPAILNESISDQQFIRSLYSRFEAIRTTLSDNNQEVFTLNAEEQTLSGEHKGCRDIEAERCQGKRECEMEMYRRWTSWVTEEGELREIHDWISGHFCPPGTNGTLHTFRVQSVPRMEQYMAQKLVVDQAEVHYDIQVPVCNDAHLHLDQQSAACNSLQTQLEEKACAHAQKINDVLNTYYNDFASAESAYHCAVQEIMELERDRKREWITLQVVNCLLVRVREQNGVPCDTANGGVTEEVGVCEERHGLAVCSSEEGEPQLCLEYPAVPEHPPFCPARDQVIGVCRPTPNPTPCCGAWEELEYGELPPVPLPPFSETNPGCNAYPACVHCPEIVTPEPHAMDSCPGYTVDGCLTSNAEAGEHPLTFVRDLGGTADVRCCSIDGDSCQSQDFEGGVDFLTPNGGTHTQCYFGVTYQEAMAVCHSAGKRICSNEEMQEGTCCNSGCWHNHHAIWVDSGEVTDARAATAIVAQGAAGIQGGTAGIWEDRDQLSQDAPQQD